MNLQQLMEARTRVLAVLNDPDATPEQRTAAAEEAGTLAGQIADFNAANTRADEARTALLGTEPTPAPQVTVTVGGPARTEDRALTPGEQFATSAEFGGYLRRGGSESDRVEVRALVGQAVAGGFVLPEQAGYVPPALRPLRLADLIDRQNTGSDTIRYIEETSVDPAGGAETVTEGDPKPEVAFAFTPRTSPVQVVAAWVPVMRQTLDDSTQVAGIINGRLVYKTEHELDRQILSGDGLGTNLPGLLTKAAGNYAAGAGESPVLSIRKAKTVAQSSEYDPDTIVLNPVDWERVELSTDNNGAFRVSPDPTAALNPRIWGLTVVVTTAIAAGTALVGAMRIGATLWDRQQSTIYVGTINDQFVRNQLSLLAELRAALTVYRPAAFVKVTFAAAA